MEKFKKNYEHLHGQITTFVQLLSQNLNQEVIPPGLDLIAKILPVDDRDLERNNVKEVVKKFTLVAVLMATVREFMKPILTSSGLAEQEKKVKQLIGKCQKNLTSVVVDGTTADIEIVAPGISGYNQSQTDDNHSPEFLNKLDLLYKAIKVGPKKTSVKSKI